MTSQFDIDKYDLYEVLKRRNILKLYHANTVATTITYLEQQALLSRLYVEKSGLYQTPQALSDQKDKDLGIWNDIFLDFVDLHTFLNRRNLYGPFLFEFDIELLNTEHIGNIRITRKNPIHWKPDIEDEFDWYYTDLSEFDKNYRKGSKKMDAGNMLIIRDIEKLPLEKYLSGFILDNPNIFINYENSNQHLPAVVKNELFRSISQNDFDHIPRKLRQQHARWCKCENEYQTLSRRKMNELKRLFHWISSKIP